MENRTENHLCPCCRLNSTGMVWIAQRIERLEKALYRLHPGTYANLNGIEYKTDCFGDLFMKNEFGTWQPVIPPTK